MNRSNLGRSKRLSKLDNIYKSNNNYRIMEIKSEEADEF